MTRKFKHAENSKHSQGDERSAEVLVVFHHQADVVRQDEVQDRSAMWLKVKTRSWSSDVVRQDGDDIDDAHNTGHVATSVGRGKQPQQVLDSKDNDAGGVQTEQLDAVVFTARLGLARSFIHAARNRLHHVGAD